MSSIDQAMDILLSSDDVNAIDQRMLELRIRRNTRIPISRLPAEILANIFLLLARTPRDWERPRKSCDWLRVTRVCSSWRKIALEYAPLWSEIRSPVHKDRMLAFLERSKDVDLTLDFGYYDNYAIRAISSDILELIRHNMSRVRAIRISVRENADWSDIEDLFKSPVPNLRCLCLDASPRWHYGLKIGDRELSVQLNKLALIQPVVPLEEVTLIGIVIPWNSPVFQGLTSLSLNNIDEDLHMTIDELFDILVASPSLQELELDRIGPRLSQAYQRNRGVELPQLKNISISTMTYKAVIELVSNLVFPRDIDWSITEIINPFVGSEGFPQNLLDRSTFCDRLKIEITDYDLTVKQVHDNTVTTDQSRRGELSFGLDFKHDDIPEQKVISLFRSLEKFFKHSFFSKLTQMTLEMSDLTTDNDDMISLTSTAWSHLFAAFSNLRRLHILFSGEDNTGLENNLFKALTNSRKISTGDIVCPKLEDLEITRAAFSSGMGRRVYKKLLANLTLRREKKHCLKYIKFVDCEIGDKELEEMKKLDIAETITVC